MNPDVGPEPGKMRLAPRTWRNPHRKPEGQRSQESLETGPGGGVKTVMREATWVNDPEEFGPYQNSI